MKIILSIIKGFLIGFCLLFLWNGIKITFRGEDILFINGVLFRYALFCDFFYALLMFCSENILEIITDFTHLFPNNNQDAGDSD